MDRLSDSGVEGAVPEPWLGKWIRISQNGLSFVIYIMEVQSLAVHLTWASEEISLSGSRQFLSFWSRFWFFTRLTASTITTVTYSPDLIGTTDF